VRDARMVLRALGVERTVVEDVVWEHEETAEMQLVVHVRPLASERSRCPQCGRSCPGYDAGEGRRRWRAPNVGLVPVHVEAAAPRVQCPTHGVLVASVPWARAGSRFTRAFEDTVAWLSVRTDRTTLCALMKVAWRTVGRILERVADTAMATRDPFEGVRRIGIDEVSYRKGHRYLTVVVDHDSGRLLWATPGRDEATLHRFFDALGERAQNIALVSADAASWVANVVRERAPNAVQCMDPFHVVQWATKALDDVRRQVWNTLRETGKGDLASTLKHARWALWKNPDHLNGAQRASLAAIERDNAPLYRAYLLKEQLRAVFQAGLDGLGLLERWLAWAARSKLKPFVKLARSVRAHRQDIYAALIHGLSNARTEATNTKLRLLTRLAYGFHSHAPLIALAMLKLGGLCPPLPSLV
jgi:transposase